MSRTLFWYILKDLLRVFLMTSGALAGIMSFGGLLRPLTEHGLDAAQVGKMLTYFMPAMMTYSLPVAALFATSVVYGRLAADNEITAMRAAGIPYHPLGGIATPALLLGLGVAIVSLVFLCFVVPSASLRVERVIYSNLAQLVANQIEHQIKYADQTIYAQDAVVAAPDPARPREQVVTLGGIMIVTYDKQKERGGGATTETPSDFYLARSATLVIRGGRRAEDEYSLSVELDGGTTFPRSSAGGFQGGLRTTHFGPVPIPSPIREETKFMDIRRLHELYADRTKSRQVRAVLQNLIRQEQSARFLAEVRAALAPPGGVYRFDAGREVFELRRGPEEPRMVKGGKLQLGGARLVEERDGRTTLQTDADRVYVSVTPTGDERVAVTLELHGAEVRSGDDVIPRASFERGFSVPMPPDVRALSARRPEHYLVADGNVSPQDQMTLRRELLKLGNGIHSELHARASFAVSCLILVLVGCALGMMFRSGNFLTAFAVSVAPALLCIALIITGQHTCENIPWRLENFDNSQLRVGLWLIWSGNIAVAAIATVLLGRLQRQ